MNQPQPIPGDGDGEEEEFDLSFLADSEPVREVYWTKDPDEIRRFYIFEKLADPDIDSKILVESMDRIFKWCVHGELPAKSRPPKLHDIKAD